MNANIEQRPIVYSDEKINPLFLERLNVVTKMQMDSITTANWHTAAVKTPKNVYSISRPFRPSNSEFVILQEFPVVVFESCENP